LRYQAIAGGRIVYFNSHGNPVFLEVICKYSQYGDRINKQLGIQKKTVFVQIIVLLMKLLVPGLDHHA
jgi:hypothetical protein